MKYWTSWEVNRNKFWFTVKQALHLSMWRRVNIEASETGDSSREMQSATLQSKHMYALFTEKLSTKAELLHMTAKFINLFRAYAVNACYPGSQITSWNIRVNLNQTHVHYFKWWQKINSRIKYYTLMHARTYSRTHTYTHFNIASNTHSCGKTTFSFKFIPCFNTWYPINY